MSRTARALLAFAALAGLVLGLVVCGAATPPPVAGPPVAGAPAPGAPGCGQGHPADEGAAGPVVPPRSHGFGELLPALLGARGGCATWAVDEGPAEATRGREPPALVPPSPVELSILRV
ncbi:hypothetical protein [Streptomyces showdoensis]|uniref:hypothetical protein n=1 Tax=Streptomyces showdoensis TaxID=68268 RepID=UPI000F4F8A39|nr:hypothetical protein [Streptomyces showdoensis]